MKKFFAIACMAVLVLVSCTEPKVKAKNQLEKLYNDVTANADSYTAEDWHNFLVEYHKVDSMIGLYEYDEAERKEIGKMKGKCSAYVVKAGVEEAKSKIRSAASEVKGLVEGMVEGLTEE